MKIYLNFKCGLLMVLSSQLLNVDGLKRIPYHELHKAMATDREEMIRLFGEDSAETVPDYKIAVIRPHRTRRGIGEGSKQYKLHAFDKKLHLVLKPNDEVVSPSLVVMKKLKNKWTQELYKPEGRFLQGHLASDPDSHVAVRELKNDKEITGGIFTNGVLYRVHPVSKKAKKLLFLKGHGHHVITRRSLKDPKTGFLKNPAFFPKPVRVFEQQDSITYGTQRRRKRRDVSTKYIEGMLTLDKVSCDYYGQESMNFVLAVANMVNRLYQDKSMELDVRFILTKVILVTKVDPGLDVQKNQIDSAYKYMGVFATWSKNKNSAAGEVGHFDNGALLSRDLCGLKDCSLGGLAYGGIPCSSSLAYSVNTAKGIDSAFTVAHEMGHNFGLGHDWGSCNKGYIMAAGQGSGPNSFKWSKCSSDALKAIFTRQTCFDNKPPPPPTNIRVPKLPPGYMYNGDKQCKFMLGSKYRLCPITLDNCELLFCMKSGGCSSLGTAPVDGTPCGIRKWCVGGVCTDVGSSLPPPVDGGWGAWGSYVSCSRTCGGGIRYRTRVCDNPRPQHDGKPCPGSSEGKYDICSTQACASNVNYRTEQCKKKNPQYIGFHIRAGQECYLWCMKTGAVGLGEGTVADGTKYNNDPLNHDICIKGKRIVAGCDNVINSGSEYDRCMKCNGDGSGCVAVKGVYDKDYREAGVDKADPMFEIPVGSTYFRIRERSPTYSVLNIKLKGGSFIFPNRPQTSTRDAAGTTIKYTISNNLNDAESMEFKGPNTAILVPMFVNTLGQENVGYDYFYYKLGQGPSTTFVWRYKTMGSCSTSCARGSQAQVVSCHRKDDETVVSHQFCDLGNKPAEVVPCNTDPCPAKWEPELWKPCSKRCGGGNRSRLVPCVQQVTVDIYRNVEYSYCNISARPPLTGTCNEVDCGVGWVPSTWSKCVDPGIATREVKCQNIMANGTVISLNRTHCDAVGHLIPQTRMNCTVPANSHYIQPSTVSNLITVFVTCVVFGLLG